MAVSDQDIVEQYRALHHATLHLLDLARSEDWPGLREAMIEQQRIVDKLQSQPPVLDALSDALQQEIAGLLQDTEIANKELADRVDLWKNELSTILQNIGSARVNVRKLARAYG